VRTRESALEVKFGLKVQFGRCVMSMALLNGMALRAGSRVDATLDDKIIFQARANCR
jgi:hypothetical protein